MKKVIRNNVFETNSSSTHSLTISRCINFNKMCEDCSFEIRSNLAKVVWLLGHIDNAVELANYDLENEKEEYNDILIKSAIVNELNDIFPEVVEQLKEKFGKDFVNTIDLIELHNKLIDMGYLPFSYGTTDNYLYKYDDILFLKRVRGALIEAYCEVEKLSKGQALKNIKHEAFGLSKEQEEKFLNPLTRKEMVRYAKEHDYTFMQIFKENSKRPIEEIIEIYLAYKENMFYNTKKGKISCCKYFNEGSLYDCNCGFENVTQISTKLTENFSISQLNSSNELINAMKDFLSPRYKIVGVEKYCGEYLTGGNNIY